MSIAVLGIDLGKNSCGAVGLDENGVVVKRRGMRRDSVAAFTRHYLHEWWRWKHAVTRTTWAGCCWRRATRRD